MASMARDLSDWTPRPRPSRGIIEGRYARLEPIDPARHADDLFEQSVAPGMEERFRYLFDTPPATLDDVQSWLERVSESQDPMFWAVADKASGRVAGRQAFMRIEPVHGVIEIGSILWGPAITRTRVATEALYLFARHAFEDLGYRRFEWKCDNRNEPSKSAARRFGFSYEGLFRQHMVIKGANRDTAWFAIVDQDWPALKLAYEAWLAPENFDEAGRQKTRLMAARPA